MVLVYADPIEPKFRSVFEQVDVGIVELVALLGIEQPGIDVDPHGAVLFPEIRRQIRPRHEVKPCEFHHTPPSERLR
jgi:hypothetical protein